MEALLDCKLEGVATTDVLSYYERELGRVDVDLLTPSWMLFSDGFRHSRRREFVKRLLDVVLAGAALLVLWPFMLATALAVYLEAGRPDAPPVILLHGDGV
jgi:hypothetical protein